MTTISTHFTKRNDKDEVVATLCSEVRFEVRWINNLWVAGEYRGDGVATELLQLCIEEFYGQDLYLMVRAYNEHPMSDQELVDFYEKYGFEEIDGAPSIMVRSADEAIVPEPKKKKKPKKSAPVTRRSTAPLRPEPTRFRGQAEPHDDDDDEEEEEPKPVRRTQPAKNKKSELPKGHRPPFHVEGVGAFDESTPDENDGVVAKPEKRTRRGLR